jgi:hypothetical protein
MKYIITVGANNTTKQVERDLLETVLERHEIEGASLVDIIGYWRAEKEPAVRVEVIPTKDTQDMEYFKNLCLDIRDTLSQQAVMLEVTEASVDFI